MLSYIMGSLKDSLTLCIWQFPEEYLLLRGNSGILCDLSIVVFKQTS